MLALAVTVASGMLGFLDDYLAIRNERNLGLNKRGKLSDNSCIAAVFAVWRSTGCTRRRTSPSPVLAARMEPHVDGMDHARRLRDHRHLERGQPDRRPRRVRRRLGDVLFGVLAIIGYWQFRHFRSIAFTPRSTSGSSRSAGRAPARASCGGTPRPRASSWATPGPWRSAPDLGALCLLMNLDLLLVVIGGLFVAETASVILQVFSFRVFGRRIFRIAPFHTTSSCAIGPRRRCSSDFGSSRVCCAMLGLGIFYGDFLKIAKVVWHVTATSRDYRRPAPAPEVHGREGTSGHPLPRGNATSGRVLLLVTTACSSPSARSPWRRPAKDSPRRTAARRGLDHGPRRGLPRFRHLRALLPRACGSTRLGAQGAAAHAIGLGLLAGREAGRDGQRRQRWLNLHVIDLQPRSCSSSSRPLRRLARRTPPRRAQHWVQLAMWTLPVSLGCGLIVIEPDIGTAVGGRHHRLRDVAVAGLSARRDDWLVRRWAHGFGVYLLASPTPKRFFSFLHPNSHLLGSGYQLLQSKIGLGAGGSPASAWVTAVRSGDCCPIRTPTSSSPSSARSWGSSARSWSSRCSSPSSSRGAHRPKVHQLTSTA
jgi:phospho-N-acetylmuramoyl-pentapeptide-transferase